jgi:hypothetical protein
MSFNYIKKFGESVLGHTSITHKNGHHDGGDTVTRTHHASHHGKDEDNHDHDGFLEGSYQYRSNEANREEQDMTNLSTVYVDMTSTAQEPIQDVHSEQQQQHSVIAYTQETTTFSHGTNAKREEGVKKGQNPQINENHEDSLSTNGDECSKGSPSSSQQGLDDENEYEGHHLCDFMGEVTYEESLLKAKKWTEELESIRQKIEDARVSNCFITSIPVYISTVKTPSLTSRFLLDGCAIGAKCVSSKLSLPDGSSPY